MVYILMMLLFLVVPKWITGGIEHADYGRDCFSLCESLNFTSSSV